MPITSEEMDVIIQQIETLSLPELLELMAKFDTAWLAATSSSINLSKYQTTQFSEREANEEDNSLEQVIQLVDEWMTDESGYDEETYPQIEAALTQNRLSV